MNNIIEIKGTSLSSVKKVLKNWIALYSDSFPSKLNFKLFEKETDCQIIVADKLLDNLHFFYLVNFLEYPEGIEYNVEIKGYTKGKNIDKKLNNKELLIYISKTDKEYDNVYAVTKHRSHYKINFSGKVTEHIDNKAYTPIDISKLEDPIILSTRNKKIKQVKKHNSDAKISKRFKVICYISIVTVLIHFFVPFLTDEAEIIEIWTLFTGMVFGYWFLVDYEMLKFKKIYLKSLLISIVVVLYGYLFQSYYQTSFPNLSAASFLCPLSLLIIQYPIRHLYKMLFNREPKVEKNDKFADLIYTIILFFSLAILPYILLG
jgi:hypothetical protein